MQNETIFEMKTEVQIKMQNEMHFDTFQNTFRLAI